MARYYDMDKLKEMIEAKVNTLIEGKEAFLYVAGWLNLLPAADVVPKSEVERLQAQNETLEITVKDLRFRNKELQEANEGLANNIQDLEIELEEVIEFRRNHVEKIFEEIEKIRLKEIHKCETLRERENEVFERKYWEGGYNSLRQLSHWIAELKNKYIGEEK